MADEMAVMLARSNFCEAAVEGGVPVLVLAFVPLILDLRTVLDIDPSMPRERLEFVTVLLCFALLTMLMKRAPRTLPGQYESNSRDRNPSVTHSWKDDILAQIV